MFTGIIETLGKIYSIQAEGSNVHFEIKCSILNELKVDQSISHNGICLTVVEIKEKSYVVTAIQETLDKTNLGTLIKGDIINLERAMKLGDRLDGHLVQGHVDQIASCIGIKETNGSHYYTFRYDINLGNITIEKGSITVNGVSLTVVNSKDNEFSVAIIPYTYNQTNFKQLKIRSTVNLEFDVVGKYLKKLSKEYF